MTETTHTSDSEMDDPNKITDAASCLDYLKRREVFLYKMMNDPSHKAMLYFLEVLMNSDSPITVEQLAARFSHKTFSAEMRDACGGGSADGLREFLQRYPSLFNVKPNGQVTSVAIELPSLDSSNFDGLGSDQESCFSIKENSQKSMSEHVPPVSCSTSRNSSYTVNSNYSSKTCPSVSGVQKEYPYNRFYPNRKANSGNINTNHNSTYNNRLNSTSCLSLISDQSNGSSNLAQNYSDHSLGRKKTVNIINTTKYNSVTNNTTTTTTNISSSSTATTMTTMTNNDISDHQPSRAFPTTNASSTLRTKQSNIYQPPQLRNPEHAASLVLSPNCGLCSSTSNLPTTATTTHTTNNNNNSSSHNALLINNNIHHELPTRTNATCIHCPLIELTCHHHHHTHHCSTAHHHATSVHCHCTTSPLTATPSASLLHHIHHPTQTALRSPLTNYCNLPPMEKFILESEAVHFFQQKLMKRDERWIPIKSLAGHLSQASPEIRAIVGPQLEFRRFLLKHPHIFEVQGELVSVKDPFVSGFGLKKSRDRLSAIHASHSSSNLSNVTTQSYLPRNNTAYERNPRPKSLILPNMLNFGHLSDVVSGYYATTPAPPPQASSSSSSSSIQRNMHRRSAHFHFENPTKFSPNKSLIQSDSLISSEPGTPISSNPVFGCGSSRVQTEKLNVDKSTSHQSNGVSSTKQNTNSLLPSSGGVTTLNTLNSISLTMSANEYRTIMFLRKVLEKHGGAPGQSGLNLHELMQFLLNKAPETIQTTIGWTKIELEEFLSQHNLFFELKSMKTSLDNVTNDTTTTTPVSSSNISNNSDCSQIGQCQQQQQQSTDDVINVCNKRLNRMINIIITASKPFDVNGVRTLTNRCGRIFHVAKLWGIIDLGKHEHVFFDKSIFRHVDDLQKHFKVDEILYFNAVLAPRESRAKWRATHVWKECDRENVEKFGALTPMKKFNSLKNNHSKSLVHNIHNCYDSNTDQRHGQNALRSHELPTDGMNHAGNVGIPDVDAVDDDDDNTEMEEEIEDFIVESSINSKEKEELVKSNHQNHLINTDSDLDYALADDDDDEEIDDEDAEDDDDGVMNHENGRIMSSTITNDDSLNLPIDIKFISSEIEEEMERVLNLQSKHNRHKMHSQLLLLSSSNTKSSCTELYDSSHSTEFSHQTQSEPCCIKNNHTTTTTTNNNNSSSTGMVSSNNNNTDNNNGHNRHHSLVTSSTGCGTMKFTKTTTNHLSSSKEDSGTSSSLSEMSAVSIAVQTVSTGDIMATQLYHDNKV
ncbi:unnamed protein product [Schistosoma turkestanicum]|nr:unnamed protein product [Schistosoma turkestanicum]